MPLGESVNETGLLLRERGQLILQRDKGGRWRLDAPLRADRLLGRRVTIEAKRSGYDLLDVHAIALEGAEGSNAIRSQGRLVTIEIYAVASLLLVAFLVG